MESATFEPDDVDVDVDVDADLVGPDGDRLVEDEENVTPRVIKVKVPMVCIGQASLSIEHRD